MSSSDEEEESDPPKETEPSTSDGSYTEETTPTTESESSFSDHSENYEMDEAIQRRIIEDWPDEVWQEHYENKPHVKEDTCYVIDGDSSHQWHVIDMISEPDPVLSTASSCSHFGQLKMMSIKDQVGCVGETRLCLRRNRDQKKVFLKTV